MDERKRQGIIDQLLTGTFRFGATRDCPDDILEFVSRFREAAGDDHPDSRLRRIEIQLLEAKLEASDP